MRNDRRPGSKGPVLCLAAVIFHLVYGMAAALPGFVFCHRPGGRVVVEFDGPNGVCLCQECDHCREHLARAAAGDCPSGPLIDACHCSHEAGLHPAGGAVLKRDEGKASAFRAPDQSLFLVFSSFTVRSLTAAFTVELFAPPPALPGAAIGLRC